MLVKITTKHPSYSLVTFVTHKRFAVLFFLPSCCVNSLLSDDDGNENGKTKIIRITLVKQQLRRCITIFSTLNYLTTKTWNCLISLFVELAWTQVSYFPILFLNLGRFPFVKTGRLDHCLTSHLANEIGFSQEFFSEKPSPSCIMFRIKEKFSLWRECSGRPILTNGKWPKAL